MGTHAIRHLLALSWPVGPLWRSGSWARSDPASEPSTSFRRLPSLGWRRSGCIVWRQNAGGGAVEVVILTAAQVSEEGTEGDQADCERDGDQEQIGHCASAFGPGRKSTQACQVP